MPHSFPPRKTHRIVPRGLANHTARLLLRAAHLGQIHPGAAAARASRTVHLRVSAVEALDGGLEASHVNFWVGEVLLAATEPVRNCIKGSIDESVREYSSVCVRKEGFSYTVAHSRRICSSSHFFSSKKSISFTCTPNSRMRCNGSP